MLYCDESVLFRIHEKDRRHQTKAKAVQFYKEKVIYVYSYDNIAVEILRGILQISYRSMARLAM